MPNDLALHGDSPHLAPHTHTPATKFSAFVFCVASAVWQRAHQFALMISASGNVGSGEVTQKKGAKMKIKQN